MRYRGILKIARVVCLVITGSRAGVMIGALMIGGVALLGAGCGTSDGSGESEQLLRAASRAK